MIHPVDGNLYRHIFAVLPQFSTSKANRHAPLALLIFISFITWNASPHLLSGLLIRFHLLYSAHFLEQQATVHVQFSMFLFLNITSATMPYANQKMES